MDTSLTERGGLPLLAAWLAGASVCAVFALIACFALPVVFSAQGGPDIQLGLAPGYP